MVCFALFDDFTNIINDCLIGTSSMMSQSAPNSTDPKFQVHSDSFQRGKIEDGVAYARGSDW